MKHKFIFISYNLLINGNKDNISWISGTADATYVEVLAELLTVEEIITGISNYNNGISPKYADFLRKIALSNDTKIIEID